MLAGLDLPVLAVLLWLGVIFDLLLGEARRWHPLVGFGRLATALEAGMNRGAMRVARGALAWLLAVAPFTLLAWAAIRWNDGTGLMLHAVLLYFCLGLRSLREHTVPIAQALHIGDLAAARLRTSRIVSRDTANVDAPALARAAVESLLENGNDAVFGTLFWFAVAGGPGALLFRLANTLDAMWGYRTLRFLAFGRAAARIDDVLNWPPARLTALSYTLLGNTRAAWHCWRTQARRWSSPNAGPVMAAGAGALELALGGPACYHGQIEDRPPLGIGAAAGAADIDRAWRLVARTVVLWLAFAGVAAAIVIFRKGTLHA